MRIRALAGATALAMAQLAALPASVFAADGKDIVGTWKLASYQRVDDVTKKKLDLFGDKPSGYAMFGANGRSIVVMTGSNRRAAKSEVMTDAERAELYKTMIAAYSASYKVEGSKLSYDPDVAWNPGWLGTKQVREFKIVGDSLTIINHGTSTIDGKKFTSTLTYTRVP